ncbi:TPA: hypothetical protein R4K21_003059 [Stenotrophomonas maltophilia]|nr:hypothetical protein [Stenotrophomonas maltophilia]
MASNSVNPQLDPRAVAEAVNQQLNNPKTVQLAIVGHYVEEGWRDNPMNEAITNRLHTIDRCIAASSVMRSLLHRDAMAKLDIQSQGDDTDVHVVYPVLKYDEADALFLGMQELMMQAQDSLQSIRDDAYGIATRQSKGER